MTVATLLCGDHPKPTAHHEFSDAQVITELCRDPTQIVRAADSADRLVLVLHRSEYERTAIQTAARSAGIDPLGVQLLDIDDDHLQDADRLSVVIAGARARATAFAGSEPEHARPFMPEKVSRRSLLSVLQPEYEAVPMVDHNVCAATDGCRACAEICPQEAYSWSAGRIRFDRDACIPCGRCITVCPTSAIQSPTVTPPMIAAQISALVGAANGPIGVAFICQRGTRTPGFADWFEIAVPCTAMVPGTWLLASLLAGAAAATALPCGSTGCPLQQDEQTLEALGFAQAALAHWGLDTRPIPDGLTEISWLAVGPATLADPFGIHGPPEVMNALMSASWRRPDAPLVHPGSPIGEVAIDPDTCTLCTMCSETCPTGALDHATEGGRLELSFDPGLCTACGQCVPMCPELERGAIRLTRVVDAASLEVGRRIVNEAETLVCESCGKAIAPSPMMDRIGDILGNEHAAAMSFLTSRCMDCRGIG